MVRAHASLLLQAEGWSSEGAAAVFALRGAGSGAGVVTGRHGPPPSSPRRGGGGRCPSWQLGERLVSREETLPDSPRRGEKSRPRARSQVSRGRRDAPDGCARGDAALMPDVEATRFLDNENKDYVRQ